jgi:predicted RNA-binding Zn-ribbon protein involved in translation (DUF1610 family)
MRASRDVADGQSGSVDSETVWSSFRAYKCGNCGEDCINRLSSPAAESDFCRRCLFRSPTNRGGSP